RVLPDPGTEVESRFVDGPAQGGPAVLRRGNIRYLATRPDISSLPRLLPQWAAAAGCATPVQGAGHGVEVTRRSAPDGRTWLFAVNHTSHPAQVAATGVDVISGALSPGVTTIPAGEVAVLAEGPQ
ncbi:Beta-galactosidase C-terminal domain, partial [Streptomyces sp. MCAF7]